MTEESHKKDESNKLIQKCTKWQLDVMKYFQSKFGSLTRQDTLPLMADEFPAVPYPTDEFPAVPCPTDEFLAVPCPND